MFGKLLFAFALGLALVQSPISASAARCCAEPASQQASVLDGCCAALPCCTISADTTKQAVTPAPQMSAAAAVPAPTQFVSQIVFPTEPRAPLRARPFLVRHSPPPLAVTGIFLI